MARRVRPDERWDAGVGAGGRKPGISAMKGRSLAVDQPRVSRAFPGVRHDMAHAGGRSQTEEQLGEAAAIVKISRHRNAMYGVFFSETKIMSVPGVELLGKLHHSRALNYMQTATSTCYISLGEA
jgi:hypothetical protein